MSRVQTPRSLPQAQLMAKLAPFNNGNQYRAPSVTGSARKAAAAAAAAPAPVPSFPWERALPASAADEAVQAAPPPAKVPAPWERDDEVDKGPQKKEVSAANRSSAVMNDLLAAVPEEEESDEAYERRMQELEDAAQARAANSLIGGQAGGDDVWKTSQQRQNEGEEMGGRAKRPMSKRINMSQRTATVLEVRVVDPLTFAPLCYAPSLAT